MKEVITAVVDLILNKTCFSAALSLPDKSVIFKLDVVTTYNGDYLKIEIIKNNKSVDTINYSDGYMKVNSNNFIKEECKSLELLVEKIVEVATNS